MIDPILSVVTITYNHAPYIRKCIERVLMQQVSFPIEFIIADDCSKDNTKQICEEYARAYPELIRIITSDKNVGVVENEQRAFLAARGRYIATCEGDDYWTDPLKLQKQVDFLESNPDYSVCFHRYNKLHCIDGSWEDDGCNNLFPLPKDASIEISMHLFMHQWCTQYLTMVFRKECYDFDAFKRYQHFRDTHQVYHLMKNGKCRLFSFYGGVYRITGSGEYTNRDAYQQELIILSVNKELWKNNNDIGWKKEYCHVLQDIIYHKKNWGYSNSLLLTYAFHLFAITFNIPQLLRNIRRII